MVATRRHPDSEFPDNKSTTSASKTSSSPRTGQTAQLRSASSLYTHLAPYSLTLWLLISLPVVIWDSLYVFLRPHTMPGGQFHSPIWTPYALYGTVDYVYGWPAWNERNGFTPAQSSLNAAETLMYGYYLWIVWSRGRGPRQGGAGKDVSWFLGVSEEGRRKVVDGAGLAVVVAFSGLVMTVSKTVLYWLHEYYSGFANVGHNDFITLLMFWIIPNGVWLVLPSYMIYQLGIEIVDTLDASSAKAKK